MAFAVIAAALIAGLAGAVAQAPDLAAWPTKPIKAFIPFGAGSATDVVPRAVFDRLATELGQPIVIENRGGAGGTLGVGAVVRAEPDGHTILANSSAHTIAPWIVPNIPYDTAKDLAGALMIGQNANVLIVSPPRAGRPSRISSPIAKANRGTVNYGSAGVGTATHMSAERFRLSAGIEAVHIPYKGGAEALTDVLGGRVDFYFCPISTALPFIRDGRVLALVVSTPTRMPDLPDVPTSLEAGYRGFRHDDLVRRLHAGEDAARHRRQVPCRRHEAARDAADAGEVEAARGLSDAAHAGRNRQAGRRRDRGQRQADKGRGHAVSRTARGRNAPMFGRMEWTSGRSPMSCRSRRRSGRPTSPPSSPRGSAPSSATVRTANSTDQPCCGDIEAVVKAHGLVWRSQPVRSGAVTIADAQEFGALLAELPKPVLAYCRSGTRCATLWSLSEAGKRPLAEIVSRANAAGYDVVSVMERTLNPGA